MPNVAFSVFSIYGDDAINAQVAAWHKALQANLEQTNATNSMRSMCQLFYANSVNKSPTNARCFGCKWIFYRGGLTFESASYPPFQLQKRIQKLLSPLDSDVIVEMKYDVEGGIYGYILMATKKDGKNYVLAKDEIEAWNLSFNQDGEFVFEIGNDDKSTESQENYSVLDGFYERRIRCIKKIAAKRTNANMELMKRIDDLESLKIELKNRAR